MSRVVYEGKLSSRSAVQGGALCLGGTRLTVSTLLRWIAEEEHPELVSEHQGLSARQVKDALLELASICDGWQAEVRFGAEALGELEP